MKPARWRSRFFAPYVEVLGKSRDERDHLLLSRRATSRRPLVLIEINDGRVVRAEVVFREG